MLKKTVLFLWMLPVFFLLHGFSEHFEYLSLIDIGSLCIYYCCCTSVLAGFFYLFFRRFDKAALSSFLCTGLYLFFGSLQDGLASSPLPIWLSRYSSLLILYVLILFSTFYVLKRKKEIPTKLKHYLNLVLLLLVVMEIITLSSKYWKTYNSKEAEISKKTKENSSKSKLSKPDIYFLLFDEFASPSSIFEQTGFKNDLYSFLEKSNFKCILESRSNYNFTPFSMASILNMDYLTQIKNPAAVGLEEYNFCTKQIKENKAASYLKGMGYEIRNYSIFDLTGHPSRIEQSFLPLNTTLISASTLGSRLWKDMSWHLIANPYLKGLYQTDFFRENKNNLFLLEEVKKAAAQSNEKPFFLYAHFMMPHTPYYYDELGRAKDLKTVFEESREHTPLSYAHYSGYASTKIKELVTSIQKKNPTACIILLGDHGFRNVISTDKTHYFRNLNALYFPDHNYSSFPDSMSNVNEFRKIFNKLFNGGFPMLKDSSIFLKDKQ